MTQHLAPALGAVSSLPPPGPSCGAARPLLLVSRLDLPVFRSHPKVVHLAAKSFQSQVISVPVWRSFLVVTLIFLPPVSLISSMGSCTLDYKVTCPVPVCAGSGTRYPLLCSFDSRVYRLLEDPHRSDLSFCTFGSPLSSWNPGS